MKTPSSATHRYSILVAAATALLIVAGGLVTSTESGLSVPDWPLSYGMVFPPMVGGIRFEHTHRMIAGTVGFLTLALTFLLFRDDRKWVRGFGVGASLAVLAQAILGGITVLYLLPTWVSVSHACLAQTFFCLVASIALFTSPEWRGAERVESRYAGSLQRLLVTTTAFIYLQLVAGAIVRHAGFGLRYHMALAFLIAIHALYIVAKAAYEDEVRRRFFSHAVLLGALVTGQVFLGFASFIFTRMLPRPSAGPSVGEVLFTTAHQTLGALILVTCLLLTLRSYRLLKRMPSAKRASALSSTTEKT